MSEHYSLYQSRTSGLTNKSDREYSSEPFCHMGTIALCHLHSHI